MNVSTLPRLCKTETANSTGITAIHQLTTALTWTNWTVVGGGTRLANTKGLPGCVVFVPFYTSEATNDLPLNLTNLAATPCRAYCTVQFSWSGGYPKEILQKIWGLVLAVYHSRDQRQNTQPVEQEDHVCNCVKKAQEKFPYRWLWTAVGQGPHLANTKGLVVLFWYPSEQVKPQMTCPIMTK